MKLSIGMIVKNGERWLDRCLSSLVPVLEVIKSELIVVDTGSEDRSVEIASRYTDKVYAHPWQNDFAYMRNIVVNYARGEWFWAVDADEILETPRPVIEFLTSSRSRKYNSATVLIKNITDENNTRSVPAVVVPRLFRREPGFGYRGAIHEQPIFRGPIVHLPVTFLHYGYLATDKELMEQKFRRNTMLLKSELEKDPDNIYYWYQLSQSYAMHKDFEDAVEPIMRAYHLMKQKTSSRRQLPYVYGQLILLHYQLGRLRDVIRFSEEAITQWTGYPDFYFFRAKAHAAVGELREAVDTYNQYLDKLRTFRRSEVATDTSFPHHSLYRQDEALRDLVSIHHRLDNFELAGRCALQVESVDSLEPVLEKTIESFVRGQCIDDLVTLHQRVSIHASPKVSHKFRLILEQSRLRLDPEMDRELSEKLASGDDEYAALNAARVVDDLSRLQQITIRFQDWNWDKAPLFYGDLFYLLLRHRFIDWPTVAPLSEHRIIELLTFAHRRHPDLPITLADQLPEVNSLGTLAELRLGKAVARYVMLHNDWSDRQYKDLFDRYIQYGVSYLERLYNHEVLENLQVTEVKNDEEAALLFVRKANLSTNAVREKIQYLRKAVERFSPLAKGLGFYLQEIEDQLKASEFARHSGRLKTNIEFLIQSGCLDEAETLLMEYENLAPKDPAIFSIRSVIRAAYKDFDEAHKVLREGASIHPYDFDIWFNLAYIAAVRMRSTEAREALAKAESLVREKRQLEDLYHLRRQLGLVPETEAKNNENTDARIDELWRNRGGLTHV